jgi:hypothetical protein
MTARQTPRQPQRQPRRQAPRPPQPRRPPQRRPLPTGDALFTPGASAARLALEKASARPIAFLHQLPRWLVPIVLAAAFVAGISAAGWAGAVALLLVAAFIGWLASLSWPALHAPGRLLRVAIIIALIALALWQGGR